MVIFNSKLSQITRGYLILPTGCWKSYVFIFLRFPLSLNTPFYHYYISKMFPFLANMMVNIMNISPWLLVVMLYPYEKSPFRNSITIWLWLTVRHGKSPFSIGKPSISIRAIYTMAMLVITRGYPHVRSGWAFPTLWRHRHVRHRQMGHLLRHRWSIGSLTTRAEQQRWRGFYGACVWDDHGILGIFYGINGGWNVFFKWDFQP